MRQHINSYGVANTVRMLKGYPGGAQAALVEEYSDVRLVSELTRRREYHVVPAHSRVNLLGVVDILAREGWAVACTAIGGERVNAIDLPPTLRRRPWLSGTWDGVMRQARALADDQLCIAVLPRRVNEPAEETLEARDMEVLINPKGGINKKEWTERNARRVALIKKQLQQGITAGEREELTLLQSEMRRQLNAAHPLPFDALDRLEERVKDAERRLADK